ncbi:MAG TPA: DUF1801 domain-containing protein [Polyangiaceae bacterium]|jgi:hypothetical protein|nr:DUF1801 domain-containing protein [Polyangiaceae bacterium]
MNPEIQKYNSEQAKDPRRICELLATTLDGGLPEAQSKIWHRAPVWFIEDNPIVGYWVRKNYVQLLFWSGQSFGEPRLLPEGKFKAAELRFTDPSEVSTLDLSRWLKKARTIQWDYKNIVKRRGVLEKIGTW